MNSTQNLKLDHLIVRRLGRVAETCSNKLYKNEEIPIEDLEIISVVMEEFVDRFHHGKEEKSYFPKTKEKNGYSEDIRKFLIEHELGRRIANMFRRELKEMQMKIKNMAEKEKITINISQIKEPIARFLKAYSVFITDHTRKEDNFFDMVERKQSISSDDDEIIKKHYEICKFQIGGEIRIQKMINLIEYLEDREWMNR
ncbi:MAG TPA: hemerythrin domain-containing protein [Nitrososphaeraceae archaeon]|nr:hemerythrin domain-containing protein [Nitrososphaeraceae archaeon]